MNVLRGEAWLAAHPKETRRGGHPQVHIPVGTRFGRLVVVGDAPAARKMSRSVCRCDCGKVVVRANSYLKHGLMSCGCLLHDAHMKHGGSIRRARERLYEILKGMLSRCTNPNSRIYKYYGGRGIRVCEEWANDYGKFRAWALANGYADGLTIDRIDTDGDYEPSNCRWVSRREQCLNKRNTLFIEIDGVKKRVFEWCEFFGIEEKLARSRIGEGKTGKEIFEPRKRRKVA